MGKFVISKRTNGEFQFNLKAGNGQVILTSEGYANKSGCENGIESVKRMLAMMAAMIVKQLPMVNFILT
ncbi:YegP family protein [Niabella sp. W65]|nr:YegP family protein [Niabella sp. W65]MCH7365795.1 YegP family protein [Niabella sp. W65]ULT41550.1 YegP family protein [Niabella sp. I65]